MKREINRELIPYKDWLNMQKKSKTTKEKYLRDVEKFRAFFNKQLSIITRQDVFRYKDYLISKYKPGSVNSYLISLNNYFAFIGRKELRVKTLKIPRKTSLNNILTENEYHELLAAARKAKTLRLYYILRVLASSGIRIGELQFITVEMLKTGKCHVYAKTKKREIILPQELCRELTAYCAGLKIQNVVFHGKSPDAVLDKSRIWREMKALARQAGVPKGKVHAHNFRHLFAKTFLAHFHDIVDLADILGHSSVEATRIYTRTSGQEKQARIDALKL